MSYRILGRTPALLFLLLLTLMITACGGPAAGGVKPAASAAPPVGTVSATLHLTGSAQSSAAGGEGIWFLDAVDKLAVEVEPATSKIVATISLAAVVDLGTTMLVTPDANALWVTQTLGSVSRVDLGTGKVTATISVSPFEPAAIAATSNPPALWVANTHENTVSRIDMHTNKVVASIAVGVRPDDIQVAQGSVWVCNLRDSNGVQQIDPQTNKMTTRAVLSQSTFYVIGCGSIRFTDDAVWVMSVAGSLNTLMRLDPHTFATVASVPLGTSNVGFGMAADADAVWVPEADTSELIRINAKTNQVVGRLYLSLTPGNVTLAAGSVWVSTQAHTETVLRVTPAH